MTDMYSKKLQTIVVAMIVLLQSLFLAAIMMENFQQGNHANLGIVIFILALLWLAYFKLPSMHQEMAYEDLRVIVWVPIGALLTYVLAVDFDFGGVVAASAVGTLFSIVPTVSKSVHAPKVPVAVYCGAFVGMSSTEVAHSLPFVVISGIIAGIFLMLAKNLFLGLGGKLGMLAFASVAITYLLFNLI